MTQPTVFISYSHKDEKEKDALLAHLGVLQHAGLLDVWSDDRIGAGSNWAEDISQTMAQARVAILLISANFLTSDFILNKEVPKLLERRKNEGLTVFPVVAKPCAWQEAPWLAKMNVRPKNGTPVWREGGRYADKELATIAGEVAKIVEKTGDSPEMKSEGASVKTPSEQPGQISTASPAKVPGEYKPIKQEGVKNSTMSLEKIGIIASVISAIIAIVAFAISPDLRGLIFSSATPTPTSSPSFGYQVRVQAKDTNKNIPNAVVTIEVGGKAPLDGITDSTGLARIFVSASHAGQPGRLIVETDGYSKYRKEIDITEGALPKDILLEPEP